MEPIIEAIHNLRPMSKWHITGYSYEDLMWDDETQEKPSEQEILDEINRIIQQRKNDEYKTMRLNEYPNIGDQLDAFWHAMNNNIIEKIEPFYSQIKSIKDKYPKSFNEM